MNKEDKEHTYAEGNREDDLAEHESYKGSKPQMSCMIKLASILLVIGVVLLFIFLVAIISTTASIRHQLTTLPMCNNSQASSLGRLGSSNAVTSDCSQAIELLERQQSQIAQLLDAANEQTAISVNNTYHIEQVMQTTGNTAQKLVNIVNTLTNLKNTSTSTAGVVDDILLVVDELLELHSDNSTLPYSCAEIKQRQPNSPSGVYLLINPNGNGVTYAYCHMGELCGSDGGWKRIAYIDMSDATQTCPSGFRLYPGGVRACGRPSSNGASCASVQFPSNGFSYRQICGRVTGYQFRFTDAVAVGWTGHNDLNSWYVDGVSITKGSPREHVWTFMAGHYGTSLIYPQYNCPCATGSTQTPQSFVGNHYFCESGNLAGSLIYYLLTSNPLWDGQNCGSLDANCCSAPGIPWFHRTYSVATNDSLELRVCGDQETEDEDVAFGYYEIYIK